MASRIGDELKTRALWFAASHTAEIRAETVAAPATGGVRVETIAPAVSAGTEMLVYCGEVPRDLRLDLPTLACRYAFPIKYDYAAAGRVLDAGSEVDHLSTGDTVFVHHPHQDVFLELPSIGWQLFVLGSPQSDSTAFLSSLDTYATRLLTEPLSPRAGISVRLRDDLDPVLGVFAANLETALTVVHDTPVRLGETALIFGDPALRVRMSAAATRRASRLLRWEHTVTGFEQVLKTVAETGKSGRR